MYKNMNNTNDQNLSDSHIVSSYIDFVNTTNTSLHSMIEIINNQQSSFNQILSQYAMPNNRHRQPTISPYMHTYNTNSRSNLNPNTRHNPRTHSQPRTYNLGNFVDQLFQNSIPIQTPNNFNDPVIIRPTRRQLREGTNRILFGTIDEPLNFSCPISQQDFSANTEVIQLRHCRHIFMPTHILQWFERNVCCPLCRHDIRNNETNENEPNSENEPNDEPTLAAAENESNSFAMQLASMISNQLNSDRDFSGNINIELSVDPNHH